MHQVYPKFHEVLLYFFQNPTGNRPKRDVHTEEDEFNAKTIILCAKHGGLSQSVSITYKMTIVSKINLHIQLIRSPIIVR
jgi:hypothetical protein